jgi:hypothetical protein
VCHRYHQIDHWRATKVRVVIITPLCGLPIDRGVEFPDLELPQHSGNNAEEENTGKNEVVPSKVHASVKASEKHENE